MGSLINFLFNNSQHTAELYTISEHIIEITLSENIPYEILTGGFKLLNEHNKTVMGDFSNFTTLYRSFDDEIFKYQLSNNGTVYIPPEPLPQPESYTPTIEEIKTSKIYHLRSNCEQSIINGVDIDIDEKIEHFSYTIEDQANIDDIFTLAMQTKLEQPYHCDGGICKLYTVEQITKIYIAEKINKIHHTTYFNQLKAYINTLEKIDEVIDINYGVELKGIYLNTYTKIMEQSQKIIEAISI